MDMRWKEETEAAAKYLGWTVVETDGIDDYQGWGVHLLSNGDKWAVLAWSYGSCSGCDSYEDKFYPFYTDIPEHTGEFCASILGDLIEECKDEAAARLLFSDRKGW